MIQRPPARTELPIFRGWTAPTADVIKFALWPIAIMTILHRVIVKATNGYITDDFAPVYAAANRFVHRLPVYDANFNFVDPHYLYPPSGTLLMAPLGLINITHSRYAFIGLNTIAIIAAAYVLLRMFRLDWRGVAAPALLLAMFSTETVSNTLVFTNVNGVVLLLESLFLLWLLRDKQILAGVAIGLTFSVKPILAPLLIIPLLNRQWKTFIGAIGVPVALTLIAWPLSVDPGSFLRRTAPYLASSRDYFNSAIVGNGVYYGIPSVLLWLVRIALGLMVLASIWWLYRYYRERDQLLWMATTSGIVLAASFLLGSLGQGYYSMMLFPLMLTVVHPHSMLRNWPAWLAAYGFLTYDQWLLGRWPTEGRAFEYLKITFGWGLLLVVIFAVLLHRYLKARSAGTLEQGLHLERTADADTELENALA